MNFTQLAVTASLARCLENCCNYKCSVVWLIMTSTGNVGTQIPGSG